MVRMRERVSVSEGDLDLPLPVEVLVRCRCIHASDSTVVNTRAMEEAVKMKEMDLEMKCIKL